jgi:hypothetical protein
MVEALVTGTLIAVSLFIPILALVLEYLNKKNKMRVIEKAIEHGLSLEGLSLDMKKKPRAPYRSGMVTLAAGIGIVILGISVGRIWTEALGPILGAGSIPLLVGIALIVNDKLNYDMYFNKKSHSMAGEKQTNDTSKNSTVE